MKILRFFLSSLFLMVGSLSKANTEFINAKSLHMQADTFAKNYYIQHYPDLNINKNLFVHTGRLDSRLKLPKCGKSLSMHIKNHTHSASNSTLNIACNALKRWSIFVPIRVEVFTYAVTAQRPLSKGQKLTLSHLSQKRVDVAKLRGGYFTQKNNVASMQAIKKIRTGEIIKPNMVKSADAIAKGDKVILHVEKPFLNVNVNAIALESGAIGDQIRVKNTESRKIVHGIVQKKGLVSIY